MWKMGLLGTAAAIIFATGIGIGIERGKASTLESRLRVQQTCAETNISRQNEINQCTAQLMAQNNGITQQSIERVDLLRRDLAARERAQANQRQRDLELEIKLDRTIQQLAYLRTEIGYENFEACISTPIDLDFMRLLDSARTPSNDVQGGGGDLPAGDSGD